MARILVIDDQALVRDTIRVMLEFAGHEVVLAEDGGEGLAAFQERPFDLVICDIFMPSAAGLTTMREIRVLSATTPIVAMTGGFGRAPDAQFGSDLERLAGQSGATLMLEKPFGREQLTALVDRCLATGSR
jgi:CheY-like chemotaxis protein